ncbi:MAG: DUF4153 domain-containing protein [Tissierellaceae bacterium]
MKILNRIRSTFESLRMSIRRFPITVIISTVLALSLIYLNETDITGPALENMVRLNMVLGMGIVLSLCFGLSIEKFFSKNRITSIVIYLGGGLMLALYHRFFLQEVNSLTASRYSGFLIFLLLAFLYIPRLRENEDYEYYILDIYHGFAITVSYALVLYIGLSAIFLTIDQLFDANIPGKLYYYIFLTISLVFSVPLFLANLPPMGAKYRNFEYNKALRVLLTFIVIPLISIYSIILYVYFAKILVSREWPKGLVSHLVIWYSTLSVGVIFLLNPIIDTNRVAKSFKVIFPKAILPILLMMFISIFQRVSQYGVTENRYYIIALGLWVLTIMLYFIIQKNLKNTFITISLSLVVLISVLGPVSSFSISKYSQNKRLENILSRNNMIVGGSIVPNADISQGDQREVSNILTYFNQNHKLSDIRLLPETFDFDNMEGLMGFNYNPYSLDINQRGSYFYYGTSLDSPIDVRNFDYYLSMNSWDEKPRELEDFSVEYKGISKSLVVRKAGEIVLEQDMETLVKEISKIEGADFNIKKNFLSVEDMTFETSYMGASGGVEFKIIFLSANGRLDEENDIILEGADFILLIGEDRT